MALDGIFLNKVKKELSTALLDARVDKIHQPSREEIVMSFRTKNGVVKVLFSANASGPRVHITAEQIENPNTPPMFCMLMRKHLLSGKLVDIRQDGAERVLFFDFDSTNEMGDVCRITLAMEIMGRHSNLILISNGKIIDSIKRIGEAISSVRLVLPGMTYEMPPREERLSLLEFDEAAFREKLSEFSNLTVSKALMKILEGISPVFSREVEFYALKNTEKQVFELSDDEKDRLIFFLKNTSAQVKNDENKFVVLKDKEGRLKDFCFTKISQYGNLMITKEFDSACALLDYFYSERDALSRVKQRAADLFKFLMNTTDRITRRLQSQKEELLACENRENLKRYGDLISANIYRIGQGVEIFETEDFYEESIPTVSIKLDKRLTPAKNAQKYYTEYRKLDTAEKKLKELIKLGEEELKYIESVFDALTRAGSEAEISELREELSLEGYIKKSRIKGKPAKIKPPLKFISNDGFEILVGRNNTQNDKLTLKTADKNDIWLHTQNITGSHVVISAKGQAVPETTIYDAAVIAAYHSSARESAQVPVDYTLIKYVKKPNGAKPGMVIFTNNKTLFVKPDYDEVEEMKKEKQG